jgi:hypothetical protein
MTKKKAPKNSTRASKKFRITSRTRHDDLPASVGLVKEARAELGTEIQRVRTDIQSVRNEIQAVRQEVVAEIHRTQALMEEQRGENKIVLDGIKALMERQDRVEEEKEFQETLQILVSAKKDVTT